MTSLRVLAPDEWRRLRDEHVRHATELTADHLYRASRGERHPVWDFLFHYYPVTAGKLKHWSPGGSVILIDGPDIPFFDEVDPELVGAEVLSDFPASEHQFTMLNDAALWAKRGTSFDYIENLLRRTMENPAHFDCFGLHEWAMVYRDTPRHPEPLRLGAEETNRVVENHSIRCTHYDAYRFFTPAAAPLNAHRPTRQSQPACEQVGCLHAGMDLYKWATKLGPLVPGDLWLDTFELAKDIRALDMMASPYDLTEWGFAPVKIETPEGKAEYVSQQREFSRRGTTLRTELLGKIRHSRYNL